MKDQIHKQADRLADDCVKFLRDILALPNEEGDDVLRCTSEASAYQDGAQEARA